MRDNLLTAQDVARLLQLNVSTVRAIPLEELPCSFVGAAGTSRRYARVDVEAYIENKREGKAP